MGKFHTFKAVVHNTQIRFNVPVAVARSLGLKSGDFLSLAVKSASGNLLHKDNEQLRSGYELYGKRSVSG